MSEGKEIVPADLSPEMQAAIEVVAHQVVEQDAPAITIKAIEEHAVPVVEQAVERKTAEVVPAAVAEIAPKSTSVSTVAIPGKVTPIPTADEIVLNPDGSVQVGEEIVIEARPGIKALNGLLDLVEKKKTLGSKIAEKKSAIALLQDEIQELEHEQANIPTEALQLFNRIDERKKALASELGVSLSS